jgi:type I restriction enzyme S subunit
MIPTALRDFCEFVQGGRQKLSGKNFVDAGYPAFGAGGLNGYLPEPEFDRDAVVLSAIGARCGKCFLAEGQWSSLANTQVIFPNPHKANVRFLWYQLNDEARWPRHGLAQPFIRPSDVKTHNVYLPPLDEQRRIAAILDKADALRRKRKDALTLLKELTDSLVAKYLFAHQTIELGELIAEGPTNGLYKPSSAYGDGVPILRINNFYDGCIVDISSLRRLRVNEVELSRFKLSVGDIVINRVNSLEYLGKSALVRRLQEPTVYESNMMRLSITTSMMLPEVCIALLQTPSIKRQILSRAKNAVNQSSINQRDVSGLRLPLPAIVDQTKFMAALRKITTLEAIILNADSPTGALFSALQRRAFSGQL